MAQRIDVLLPAVSDSFQATVGPAALDYLKLFVRLVAPELKVVFSVLDQVGTCAFDKGVLGVKVYVARDLSAAGGMLIISEQQAQAFPGLLAQCLVDKVVPGSGPGADWSPCMDRYRFPVSWRDGTSDRYIAYVVGTNAQICPNLAAGHQTFGPTAF